jgi:hypothetical protein
MTAALYYPHYAPTPRWLRSTLLFFDSVQTIVPITDWKGVEARPYIASLLEADQGLLEFVAPDDDILLAAFPEDIDADFDRIEAIIRDDMRQRYDGDPAKLLEEFRRKRETGDYEYFDQHIAAVVAQEKIPGNLLRRLTDSGLALPMEAWHDPKTQSVATHHPLLTLPPIADFIVARIANVVARKKASSRLTDRAKDYSFLAFEGLKPSGREAASEIIATYTSLAIPDDLQNLGTRPLLEVRARYAPVRRALHSLSARLAQEHELRSMDDYEEHRAAVDRIGRDLAHAVDDATTRAERERTSERSRFYLMSIVKLSASVVGADLGDVPGAFVGTAVGIGAERVFAADKVANLRILGDEPTYHALASLNRDIVAAANIRRYIYPGSMPV